MLGNLLTSSVPAVNAIPVWCAEQMGLDCVQATWNLLGLSTTR